MRYFPVEDDEPRGIEIFAMILIAAIAFLLLFYMVIYTPKVDFNGSYEVYSSIEGNAEYSGNVFFNKETLESFFFYTDKTTASYPYSLLENNRIRIGDFIFSYGMRHKELVLTPCYGEENKIIVLYKIKGEK